MLPHARWNRPILPDPCASWDDLSRQTAPICELGILSPMRNLHCVIVAQSSGYQPASQLESLVNKAAQKLPPSAEDFEAAAALRRPNGSPRIAPFFSSGLTGKTAIQELVGHRPRCIPKQIESCIWSIPCYAFGVGDGLYRNAGSQRLGSEIGQPQVMRDWELPNVAVIAPEPKGDQYDNEIASGVIVDEHNAMCRGIYRYSHLGPEFARGGCAYCALRGIEI